MDINLTSPFVNSVRSDGIDYFPKHFVSERLVMHVVEPPADKIFILVEKQGTLLWPFVFASQSSLSGTSLWPLVFAP